MLCSYSCFCTNFGCLDDSTPDLLLFYFIGVFLFDGAFIEELFFGVFDGVFEGDFEGDFERDFDGDFDGDFVGDFDVTFSMFNDGT